MVRWIVEKWDWMIYRLATGTLRRMCERNQGFAYLFELNLRKYREEHPISKELESSTEHFFNAINDLKSI